MGFLRRNSRECAQKVKSATYTTMVRAVLEHASTLWDPHKQQDIQLLQEVQRRAARYVTNNYTDRSLATVTSMLENLKWTSLEHRRRQIRLGMLSKVNKGIKPASFFRHSDPRTRGAQQLRQEQTQHHVLFHSFFPRTVFEWTLLSTFTSSAP